MKKLNRIFLFTAPWLIGTLLVWLNYRPTILLWPNNNTPIETFSDSTTNDNGNSGIRIVSKAKNQLKYEYTLGNDFMFPYIGLSFNEDRSSTFLDLSQYDYLEIEISANLSKRIPIVLNQNVLGFSTKGNGSTYRPLIQELEYDKSKRKYTLLLSEFKTPSWWYTSKNTTESDVGKADLSRIHFVQLHNCQMLARNTKEQSTIYSLSIHKDMSKWWWLAIGFILLYYVAWLSIVFLRKRPSKIFPRTKLDVANIADEESHKVLDYLAQHYSNAELSLEMVQKEVGISETKISAILKETADMSFKRYINHIRTEEAKRLLRETDRQVMDIAYKVGYGNISHFNRVFKEAENCSPNEYRKNASEKT